MCVHGAGFLTESRANLWVLPKLDRPILGTVTPGLYVR
jgi:hypothetical protein